MSDQERLEAAFNDAYASLNAAQKEAVDTIDGPVLVVAGPGTGKTQILTLRIANILRQTDTAPENILALTFTESGAKAMRERLRRYVGAIAYRVPIFTFHGFAGQLIAQYPDSYQKVIGGRPANDLDVIQILETILDNPDFAALRPPNSPHYYVPSLRNIIGTLKQEYVTPDRLRTIVTEQEEELSDIPKLHEKGAYKGKIRGEYTKLEKTITKNQELIMVYEQYEALLRERQLFDFNDMLLETVAALKQNEDMLRDVQEMYQYVLADEHQDVNGTQNTLLELLVSYHERPNIFAVGDEKQAIYRFQGASLENFLYFEERFVGTKTIALTENYRSGQTILDLAHSLVAVEEGPLKDLRVPLKAALVAESAVAYREFAHQAVEDDWLVEAVAATIAVGTTAEEVAVIVRTNAEVEQLSGRLRKAGLSVTASADGDILTHPITKQVENLIAGIVSPNNESALFTLMQAPYWGLSFTDTARICAARNYDWPLARLLGDTAELARLGVQDPDAAGQILTVLQTAQRAGSTQALQQVLEQVLHDSGLLTHVLETDPIAGVRVIRRLYDEVESLVVSGEVRDLADVARAFSARQAYNVPLTAPYINTNPHAVQVMTAHKSKGLEFAEVFMPHVVDSSWGGNTPRQMFSIPLTKPQSGEATDRIDDERRLLYVGMTRAKTKLHLSSSAQNSAGKVLTPSRLVSGLDTAYYETVSTDEQATAFDPAAAIASSTPAQIDQTLIAELFAARGFSATSLNNYLISPWNYLYRNILRIPETQGPALQYGTVVHNVLERITQAYTTEGALPNATTQKQWLERELGRLPLSQADYTAMHERALATLTRYSEHLASALPARTSEELKLSVSLATDLPECPEVLLTGKLDRLDWDDDGTVRCVVDYKTGKPRTRNVIEGKTASSDGGYKRQLVFYALLLELHGDERYQTRDMTLSFVEATTKGEIKEEHFTITDEEIATLKTEVIAAAKAIADGSAWQTPCDPTVSDYCDLLPVAVE